MEQDVQCRTNKAIVTWLIIIYIMIYIMVSLGGITRITGSGLSMVDWRPVFGIFPPLNEAAWIKVFEQYKTSPQYLKVNSGMDLSQFKGIFFWEYFHRVFGRLIGMVLFLPWLYFKFTKQMTPYVAKWTFFGLIWGGAQGCIGWYMVKSGLVDIPEVSHYRLTLHLFMAFFVAVLFFWIIVNYLNFRHYRDEEKQPLGMWFLHSLTGLFILQIIYGAFMGGKKAGYLYDTFPLMRGEWLPMSFMNEDSIFYQLLENDHLIHYIHRFFAFLLLGCILYVSLKLIFKGDKILKLTGVAYLVLIIAQVTTGALTVMNHVQVEHAVVHQSFAVLLITLHSFVIYLLKPLKKEFL
jgi:heme a synthase